jgi:hypothetical protein
MEPQRRHFRRRRSKRPAFSGCKPPGRESFATCLIVGPLVILLLMMIGLACSGFGLFLAYLK